jgi:hypothetical protein
MVGKLDRGAIPPWIVTLSPCEFGKGAVHWGSKSIVMRKLMMKMSISVDGFVSTTNGEVDWFFKTAGEASKVQSDICNQLANNQVR